MDYTKHPYRNIAKATKLRDWSLIDAVLEDLRVSGNMQVIRGFDDAEKELGRESPNQLAAPDPVTIHDLPSREGVEVYEDYCSAKWRKKKAA